MKKWLSVLLAVAMLLSLIPAGAVEFSFAATAEEELPTPYAYFDTASGSVEGNALPVATMAGFDTTPVAIPDTDMYGILLNGDWQGFGITTTLPAEAEVAMVIEYYVDKDYRASETHQLFRYQAYAGWTGGNAMDGSYYDMFSGKEYIPSKETAVAVYTFTEEDKAAIGNGEFTFDVRGCDPGAGAVYIQSMRLVNADYVDAVDHTDHGYVYADLAGKVQCDYYPDVVTVYGCDADWDVYENNDYFAGYTYVNLYGTVAGNDDSTNKPVYVKMYAAEGYEDVTLKTLSYDASDANGAQEWNYGTDIVFEDGVAELFLDACFKNRLNGVGSLRLTVEETKAVARIELYDVTTYCNEGEVVAEIQEALHAYMLANERNVVYESVIPPSVESGGYTGDVCCATCNVKLAEGQELPAVCPHAYDNACDTDCNLCGEVRDIVHTWNDGENTNGIKTYTCTVCGATKTVNEVGVWQYNTYGDGVVLTAYLGDAADVYVPATLTVDGATLSVLKLGDGLFQNNDTVNSVTLAEGITGIGDRAFYDADALVCVLLAESVTAIGDEAFYGCDVMNSVILYDGVTTIGTDVFGECSKVTVWCNEGTAAYAYVTENGIAYEILNPDAQPVIVTENGITYYLSNGEAAAVDCDSTLTAVTVPAAVQGHPVTKIQGAFTRCSRLVSVTLSEGVRSITTESFYFCSALTTVNLPQSLTYIGNYAFQMCMSLTNLTIPDGVTYIGKGAFLNSVVDTNLPSSLTFLGEEAFAHSRIRTAVIPQGITKIPRLAFANSYLTTVVLHEGVTTIDDYAFSDSWLTAVTIPEGVTAIGAGAFQYLDKLQEVTLPTTLTTLGAKAFYWCPKLTKVVLNGDGLWVGNEAFFKCDRLADVTVNEGVRLFGSDVFAECFEMQQIILPQSVVGFNSDTFAPSTVLVTWENSASHEAAVEYDLLYAVYDGVTLPSFITQDGITYHIQNGEAIAVDALYTLTDVVIPATVNGYPVTELRGTFARSSDQVPGKLETIVLGDNVRAIGACTFVRCSSLDNITLPEGITAIGDAAFYDAQRLATIDLPATVEYIGDKAFAFCQSLTAITIPAGVETIGDEAFYNCTKLSSVTLAEALKSIGDKAFYRCETLSDITIPYGVTTIGNNAFLDCTVLAKVTLPATLQTLGEYAFAGCGALDNIVLPQGLTTIGAYAFRSTALAEVTIPATVTTVGKYAFSSCESLTTATVEDGVESIAQGAFYGCTALRQVKLPDSVTSLASDAFPSTVILLVIEDSYAHTFAESKDLLYFLWDGVSDVTITVVDGVTYFVSETEAAAIAFDGSVTDLVMPNTVDGKPVTSIREVFAGCTTLMSVVLPQGLLTISAHAFEGCTALASVTFGDSLTSIGNNAFYNCSALTSVVLPDTVTTIGQYGFSQCKSMTEIHLPASLKKVDKFVLYGNDVLDNVVIPHGVTSIESSAFYNCFALKNVSIPSTVTYIGSYAFTNCRSLQTVYLPAETGAILATSFPTETIWLVHDGSYAHTRAQRIGQLYFVLHKGDNPEIAYGAAISGTATYTDGTPAAGAAVTILYDDGTVKETVTADANGVYTFTYAEVGRYTIRATDAAGNTAATTVGMSRMNVFDVFVTGDTALTLKTAWTVSGTVSESPATVTLTDEDGNLLASAETDENGNFALTEVPNGTYVLTAVTESGRVSTEVTVFNSDVTDITLTVKIGEVSLWGYVEVEDRDKNHHRRHWVQVTLYDEDGIVVAQQKSGQDGMYRFDGLSVGEYTVVAETAEMRPDRKHGYDRYHTLTGYAFVSASAAGEYQLDTIVLYEENDKKTTLSGKVTAEGETQDCEVVLRNVFRHEVARYVTGKNGKYSFTNVRDGLYFVIAVTKSDGMGYAVVTVRDGVVYGDTDIRVSKKQHIRDRETAFMTEVPSCADRTEVLPHKERIADEKRFYDALSEKEKKQLSKEYIDRLEQYAAWLADCEYDTPDGVTVEQGGLVISGDELAAEETVHFTLSVEETDGYTAGRDGVSSYDEQMYHTMQDAANGREVCRYYDITMRKTTADGEKAITAVYKDTDAAGKFRITLPIPEEYRGRRHYAVLHEHCGEVIMLTDLDDDPDTVTFEVDRFSTFALTATDEELTYTDPAAIVDGVYYYNGEKVPYAGLVQVDGNYYYVADGSKVKTGRYAISKVNETGVARGIYYFFEDGRMNTEVGVYEGYYYNATGKSEAYAGLIQWNGSKYYVSDGGTVKTGRYFITKLNNLVPKKRAYTFYPDGRMLEETRIYEFDGFYYEDGIRVPYAGLVEYEGNFYYVADNGAYVKGRRQLVSNVNDTGKATGYYCFDENGHMMQHAVVDGRYYGADGLAPYNAGVVQVDGKLYYNNGTHGALRTSATFTITAAKTNGLCAAGKYTADESGVLSPAE